MPVLDVLNVFVARRTKTEIGGEVEVPLDAATAIEHERSSQVTSEAIEDASLIDDHIVKEAERLTIEGVVSDHPVEILGGLLDGGFRLGGGVGDLLGQERRSQTAYNRLMEAWEKRRRLRIVTRLRTYEDMVIERLSVPVSIRNGEALRFSLALRKLRLVSLQTATLSERLVDTVAGIADRASPTADRGRQATSAASGSQSATGSARLGGVP